MPSKQGHLLWVWINALLLAWLYDENSSETNKASALCILGQTFESAKQGWSHDRFFYPMLLDTAGFSKMVQWPNEVLSERTLSKARQARLCCCYQYFQWWKMCLILDTSKAKLGCCGNWTEKCKRAKSEGKVNGWFAADKLVGKASLRECMLNDLLVFGLI